MMLIAAAALALLSLVLSLPWTRRSVPFPWVGLCWALAVTCALIGGLGETPILLGSLAMLCMSQWKRRNGHEL